MFALTLTTDHSAFVIGDPASDECIVFSTKQRVSVGIYAAREIPIRRLDTVLRELRESGREPSATLQKFLDDRRSQR